MLGENAKHRNFQYWKKMRKEGSGFARQVCGLLKVISPLEKERHMTHSTKRVSENGHHPFMQKFSRFH